MNSLTSCSLIFLSFLVFVALQGLLFFVPFDSKFTSILVDNVPPVPMRPSSDESYVPPAKRVVLISIDGNRADWFFRSMAGGHHPTTKTVLDAGACWGVSHTRAPTESRPAHTAMLAGFFEDPAAVHNMWTGLTKPFDTVLSHAPVGYQTGQYSIVGLFKNANNTLTVEIPKNTNWDHADPFVGENFRDLVTNPTYSKFRDKLRSTPGAVLFFHLPSMDSVGHGDPWGTPGYFEAVARAESSLRAIASLTPELFGDNNTAYVLSGDHGMSNYSTPHHKHGTDHPDELHTGFLMWGAGVRNCSSHPPKHNRVMHTHDSMYRQQQDTWGMDMSRRQDVDQIDIAPLVSALAGNPIPVNSRGVLNVNYLDPAKTHANHRSLVVNMMQLQTLVNKVAADVRRRQMAPDVTFRPFHDTALPDVAAAIADMERCVDRADYDGSQRHADALAAHFRDALRYYQTYDWFMLFGLTATCYALLAACGVLATTWGTTPYIQPQQQEQQDQQQQQQPPSGGPSIVTGMRAAVTLFVALMAVCAVLGKPTLAYVLSCITCVLVGVIVGVFVPSLSAALCVQGAIARAFGGWRGALFVVVLVELSVVGYVHRECYAVALALMAVYSVAGRLPRSCQPDALVLLLLCALTCVFFFLQVSLRSTVMSVVGCLAVAGYASLHAISKEITASERFVLHVLVATLLASAVGIVLIDGSLERERGVPLPLHVMMWICCAISVGLSYFVAATRRTVLVGLMVPFCILSTSYESLFLLVFLVFVGKWVDMTTLRGSAPPVVFAAHVQVLIAASFFGFGNIASMSGLDVSAPRRLVTQFHFGIMLSLIICKTALPILLVTLTAASGMPQPPRGNTCTRSAALYLLLVSCGDVMSLHFFFMLTDEGPWKEIGGAISRYVICCAELLILVILGAVAAPLWDRCDDKKSMSKESLEAKRM
eukprot:PhM_4_TR7731/c0_g1_i4/m.37920/K05285/PIGN; phosphatidylinositol glycan, class N